MGVMVAGREAAQRGASAPVRTGSLEERLRRIGAERYHDRHPFHRMLHGGRLNMGQIQAWALNRYYYQASLPIKDAVVLSKLPTRSLRQEWLHRITDHDGMPGQEGGIDRWLRLTDLLGLDRDYVQSTAAILPATRFAVDAYVNFVRQATPLAAIASSLTELFAPAIHRERIDGLLSNYDFFVNDALAYFRTRLVQAPRDSTFALDYVLSNAKTPADEDAVCAALIFKTNVLWAQLDALHHAYVHGHVPPGAFTPVANA
jgi:pyrroloquinoline-quinone synthase